MTFLSWVIICFIVIVSIFIIYKLLPSRMKDFRSLYIEALEELLRGNKENAFWKLRELVKVHTSQVNAYIILGNILRETGKPEKALPIHQSLTTRSRLTTQQKIDIYISIANDYFELKRYRKAEENATQVLQYERKNRWASEFLVKVAELQKDWMKASEQLKRHERVTGIQEPNKHACYYTLNGNEYEQAGDVQKARDSYLKAVKIDPNYTDAYLCLANLFEKEGILEKAVEYWIKFEEHAVRTGRHVFSKLEKALFELGRFGEIENFYSRLIKKDVGNVEAISGYVDVLIAKGEIDKAVTLIDDVIEHNNSSIRARLARLKLYMKKIHQDKISHEVDEIVDMIHESGGFKSSK